MNRLNRLNRLKFVDAIGREKGGYSLITNMFDWYNCELIDKHVGLLINENIFTDNLHYNKFIVTQPTNVIPKIINKLDPNDSNVNKMLKSIDKSTTRKPYIQSEKDVDYVKDIISTGYGYFVVKIIRYINDNDIKHENVVKVIEVANKYKWGYYTWYSDTLFSGYQSEYSPDIEGLMLMELFDLMKNDDLCSLSNEEIHRFSKINKEILNISYEKATLENVNVSRDEMCIYLPSYTYSSLSLMKFIVSKFKTISKKNLARATVLFENAEIAEQLVNLICTSGNKRIFSIILKAIGLDFVKSKKDLILITNKIKFGYEFTTVRDIANLVSGINLEAEALTDEQYAKLIGVKGVVSKNVYRNIVSDLSVAKKVIDIDLGCLGLVTDIMEIGQLNENQFKSLVGKLVYTYANSSALKLMQCGYKLSYQEFEFIFDNHEMIEKELLESISDMKPNSRLLKLKQTVDLEKALVSDRLLYKRDSILKVLNGRDAKELMRNSNPLGFRVMEDYFNYMVMSQTIDLPTVEDYRKAKILCKFSGIKALEQCDKTIDELLLDCREVQKLMKLLNFTNDFKSQYAKEISEFCCSEDFEIAYGYMHNNKITQSQKDSMVLIVKAIIANKYDELKFVYEDIEKELGAKLTLSEFESWKRTDEIVSGSYTIKDSSDFNTIMRIGEVPVSSCMNYKSGAYSKCLLSNFDTTKKILTIHKDGKYVGRAILRLTKMSDEEVSDTNLSFLDVEAKDIKDEIGSKNTNENIIIFLERRYTTLDNGDFAHVFDLIVDFLTTKAKEIGAKLVVSNNYNMFVNENIQYENKYVFITASKNGFQYLDSFDGSTTSVLCYRRGNVYVY